MARELSDGNHIGRLLQLDRLLVHERALVVHNHVRVERAILGSSIRRRVAVQMKARQHALFLSSEARATEPPRRTTHDPHLRGRVKPVKPPCTSMCATWRQDLQVR